MRKVMEFIKRERLYLLLLTFIILINVLIISEGPRVKEASKTDKAAVSAEAVQESREAKDPLAAKERAKEFLRENRDIAVLFSLASLLILAILLLGILIDVMLLIRRFSGKTLNMTTADIGKAGWNLFDVGKIVILFVFFGYMLIIIESLLIKTFPVIKNDNFRMMLNSSILDILALVFIFHFVVSERKESLASLGLAMKNFRTNIFYGLISYVAIVPVLLGILVVTMVIVNIVHYTPEKQPVVELFLKEKDPAFLMYTSLFAAIAGPFVEEIFFRGFMYKAAKKYIGVFWSMFLTAAIFALLHTNIVGFVPIMVLGFLLAYLYEKTGTLVSSITVHVMHNLSMVLMVFLVKQIGS